MKKIICLLIAGFGLSTQAEFLPINITVCTPVKNSVGTKIVFKVEGNRISYGTSSYLNPNNTSTQKSPMAYQSLVTNDELAAIKNDIPLLEKIQSGQKIVVFENPRFIYYVLKSTSGIDYLVEIAKISIHSLIGDSLSCADYKKSGSFADSTVGQF